MFVSRRLALVIFIHALVNEPLHVMTPPPSDLRVLSSRERVYGESSTSYVVLFSRSTYKPIPFVVI